MPDLNMAALLAEAADGIAERCHTAESVERQTGAALCHLANGVGNIRRVAAVQNGNCPKSLCQLKWLWAYINRNHVGTECSGNRNCRKARAPTTVDRHPFSWL